jgi:hypothetical protein
MWTGHHRQMFAAGQFSRSIFLVPYENNAGAAMRSDGCMNLVYSASAYPFIAT